MVNIILFLSLALTASARFKWGPCPDIYTQQFFNVTEYTGVWYEQLRGKDTPFESGRCTQQKLTPGTPYLKVQNAEYIDDENKWKHVEGQAYCEKNSSQCYVKFGLFWGDYQVVTTDYDRHALVYSCSNWYIFHFDYIWLMTRNRYRSARWLNINDLLAMVDYERDEVQSTNQYHCPKIPPNLG